MLYIIYLRYIRISIELGEEIAMCEIGIVTLWGNNNYGNRLQNYAVERIVEDAGLRPRTILPRQLRSCFNASWLSRTKSHLLELINNRNMVARRANFDRFNRNYLHTLDFKDQGRCVGLICGSDQIWNYTFPEFSEDMFLGFADGRPTISLSASFGVSEIPDSMTRFYRDQLRSIGRISVREERGAELVRELAGREAEVLVDPTMGVSLTEWEEVLPSIQKPAEDYAFTYFLGKKPANLESRIQSELGCSNSVSFNDLTFPEYYDKDPLEFVAYLAGASSVVTDSFHGAVFSILFGKPLILLDRQSTEQSMTSRLDTLASKFNVVKSSLDCDWSDAISRNASTYASIGKVLNEERLRIRGFLNDSLQSIA